MNRFVSTAKDLPFAPWIIIGESVRGASHLRSGLPNQDALDWYAIDEPDSPIVLAVADGHGSSKCFRSSLGARFAVEAATEAGIGFVEAASNMPTLSAIKRLADEICPKEILRLWNARVDDHYSSSPFVNDELEKLDSDGARDLVMNNPLLAYGSTLLTVVLTKDYIVYLQLGDGDILTVSDEMEVIRPMQSDSRLFANETTSLCSVDAWRDFRFTFEVIVGQPPALILCSSDGYSGSFRTEEDFLRVGSDLLTIIRAEGYESLEHGLSGWLNEASQMGSGDDVTLAIAVHSEVQTGASLIRTRLNDTDSATIGRSGA